MNLRPSNKQRAVIDAYSQTTDNIVVRAVAGAGKTTLLKMIFPLVRGKAIYLAFNNDIVDEIKGKVSQENIQVSTIHSLGCKAIYSSFGKVKVNKSKSYRFIKKASKKWNVEKKEMNQTFFVVDRLVELYRLTLCKTPFDLMGAADMVSLNYTTDHIDYAFEVMDMLNEYNKNPKEIDLTDMVYLPATDESINIPKPNTLFVDECQDLNAAQHAFIDRLRSRGRFVAVGDPRQSIYGFAGAHSSSFEMFTAKPRTVELPLSVTYRCPTRVVDHANKIYNVLEPSESAISGEVRLGNVLEANDGDMIVCRNLAPLMGTFIKLVNANKKCYIKGKDIGDSLIRMIKPFSGMSIDNMLSELKSLLHEKINELLERKITKPMKHPSYISMHERVMVLEILSYHCEDVNCVLMKLKSIFSDDKRGGIVLSTMHKSKGLEADGVFILDRHLVPSKYAETEDQLTQEQNLLYVAVTRSKKSLIYSKSI